MGKQLDMLDRQEGSSMLNARQHGMSLVELMIGIAIASILLMAGIPEFNLWIQNSQNRAAAESILSGIQLARMEAVTRNTQVRFEFTDDSGLVAWKVGCVAVTVDCPATIQRRAGNEGAANARVGARPEPVSTGLSALMVWEEWQGQRTLPVLTSQIPDRATRGVTLS
jgi:type IV fimbrial biogenesis protein FimT